MSLGNLPRRFGSYQLFEPIGRGGMAEIYLARASLGLLGERLVVVKQVLPALANDPAFAAMFIEEAKLSARLRHANVVQVFDLGREDDVLYMAMEYVEGLDLNQLLGRCSRLKLALPFQLALLVMREVLTGLDYAHRMTDERGAALGIVHCDVSPSNVLISLEGEVKVCDFGIARAMASGNQREAFSERIAGKGAYMAPEHARGETIDARTDLFATGIVLWELCAGRRLYRGTPEQMIEAARRAEIPPLPREMPEHALLVEILNRALSVERDQRYANAAEMRDALDDYAHSAGLFASSFQLRSFVSDNFEQALVQERRARERAARALELGPPVTLEPIRARAQGEVMASIECDLHFDEDSGFTLSPDAESAHAVRDARRRRPSQLSEELGQLRERHVRQNQRGMLAIGLVLLLMVGLAVYGLVR